MFLTYDFKLWIALMVTLPIVFIALRLSNKNTSKYAILSWIFLSLTGKGNPMSESRVNAIEISWTLGAVVLSYGFSSSLIASLTIPGIEKPMDTWQDLLDNDYTILTPRTEYAGIIFPDTMFDMLSEVNFMNCLFLMNHTVIPIHYHIILGHNYPSDEVSFK